MPYFVTSEASVRPNLLAKASSDETSTQSFELADALTHACRLLDASERNVAITDDLGRSISGQDLVDCCKGDKTIASDLRAVQN